MTVDGTGSPLLEVSNLVARYPVARGVLGTLARRPRQAVHAVEDVSFSLGRGEMLALVGESGCGKTTTAQTLLRLVEPVSMLDVSVRAGILSLLDELRRAGLGILMITHDLSTAAHYADRIAVMYLGRIVEEGPAREIVRNPQHPYTKALISVVPKRDPRDATTPQILRGETPNPMSIPSGCRFHPRCPVALPSCAEVDPELHPAAQAATPEHRAACVLA